MAYTRQATWLEQGPAVELPGGAALALRLPAAGAVRSPIVGRGVAGIPQLSQEHCDSGWSLLNPVAWLGGCVARDAANIYERVQYGSIPDPHNLPGPPVPGVPTIQNQPAVAPPGVSAADWEAWKAEQREYLRQQQTSGAWNPEGNLPVNALDLANFWDRYGSYLLIGGLGLAAIIAFKAVKR